MSPPDHVTGGHRRFGFGQLPHACGIPPATLGLVGVVGRGVLVLVVGWVLLGVHYFAFWVPLSIVMARAMEGDVEVMATSVAALLAVTAVLIEVAALARRRPGLLARWRGPAAVAGIGVAAFIGIVLFWQNVYPCSGC